MSITWEYCWLTSIYVLFVYKKSPDTAYFLKSRTVHFCPQHIFLLWLEGEKETLEHFEHVINICPN